MRKITLLLFGCSLGLLFLASGVSAKSNDIVIGGAMVISGPSASYGIDASDGIDTAVAQLNANGGVLGKKVKVVYEDTGGDPARAVAIYRKFAAQPQIVAAMSVSSMELVALNPVTAVEKLPLISLGSTIPVKKFSPYVFRTNLILNRSIGVVLDQLKKKTGTQSMAIIYDNGLNYTVSEMDAVKKNVGAAGIELTDVESFSTGDQNFTLQLTRIAQSHPDTIWVAAMTEAASLIISQARGMGIDARIIGGAGMNDPRIGNIGKAAKGLMTFALFNVNDQHPIVRQFVKRFKSMHDGQQPSAYAALGYDAMMLVANGLRRAGKVDREALRDALGKTKNFEGVDGPFRYDGSGDNLAQSPKLLVFGDHGFQPLVN